MIYYSTTIHARNSEPTNDEYEKEFNDLGCQHTNCSLAAACCGGVCTEDEADKMMTGSINESSG